MPVIMCMQAPAADAALHTAALKRGHKGLQVRVQRRGGAHRSAKKYDARVLAHGYVCDLALLTVDDEDFWHGMRFMTLGPLPFLQEHVAVAGCAADSAHAVSRRAQKPAFHLASHSVLAEMQGHQH